jgi:hypothetical protein
MIYAYLFEARSIQSYVFAGGKLRDMVAASNLVEQLTGSVLDTTLNNLDIQQDIVFSRRAGGAFYALSSNENSIKKLASIWPLIVSGLAPSLEFITHISADKQAYRAVTKGLDILRVKRNNPCPSFPIVPPIAQRAQRTGSGAIHSTKQGFSLPRETIDSSTEQKRKFAQKGLNESDSAADALAQKFSPLGISPYWPKALTPEQGIKNKDVLPRGEHSHMAVIHIDGNGLGQLLIQLGESAESAGEQYSDLYLSFSEAITKATLIAAQRAVADTLTPREGETIAARPLVLGGDDLTIIVAADKAIAFSRAFICAFEESSAESLHALKKRFSQLTVLAKKLPEKLTACGGIAFVKASYPFSSAAHLAEELCQRAKTASENTKPVNAETKASSLCWHKVTTTSLASAEKIFTKELAYEYADQQHFVSLNAYSVLTKQSGLPSLDELLNVTRRWVTNKHVSKFRQYLGYLKTNPIQANVYHRRMLETHPDEIQQTKSNLKEMWPIYEVDDALRYTVGDYTQSPLADIIALAEFLAINKEKMDVA